MGFHILRIKGMISKVRSTRIPEFGEIYSAKGFGNFDALRSTRFGIDKISEIIKRQSPFRRLPLIIAGRLFNA